MLKFKFSLLLFLIGYLSSALTLAQSLVEVHHSVSVPESFNGDVRTELTKKAVHEVSAQYIKELVGTAKFEKEFKSIEAKVISQYLKYIPIIKLSQINKVGDQFTAGVFFKVSIENLKSLLQSSGLLYEAKGSPVVTPFISIVDRVSGRSYVWWSETENLDIGYLKNWLEIFHKELRDNLAKKGFYLVETVGWNFRHQLPSSLKSENVRTEDLLILSQGLQGSILVRGSLVIEPSKKYAGSFIINSQLEALQSNNGRVVAEIVRSYETETGPFLVVVGDKINSMKEPLSTDLSGQIAEAWQKGTFGSSLLQMTVNGKLNYKQLEAFKDHLKNQVREIRGIRERLQSLDSYTFEVDSSLGAGDLALVLSKLQMTRFKVEVAETRSNSLALNVIYR